MLHAETARGLLGTKKIRHGRNQVGMFRGANKTRVMSSHPSIKNTHLKGLSHEIDFKKFDKNLQYLD